MIRAVKLLNIIAGFLFVAVLLLVYAFLPISVDLNIEGLENMHKQRFFYYAFITFLGVNLTLRLIFGLGLKSVTEKVLAWSMSLIFIMNLYLTCLIGFVGVWNNSTHISPTNYAYLNFLGPFFLIIWVGGLIFLVVKQR